MILPRGLAATVSADVTGAGDIQLFGADHDGVDISQNASIGSDDDPFITIDAELGIGQIEVHR